MLWFNVKHSFTYTLQFDHNKLLWNTNGTKYVCAKIAQNSVAEYKLIPSAAVHLIFHINATSNVQNTQFEEHENSFLNLLS